MFRQHVSLNISCIETDQLLNSNRYQYRLSRVRIQLIHIPIPIVQGKYNQYRCRLFTGNPTYADTDTDCERENPTDTYTQPISIVNIMEKFCQNRFNQSTISHIMLSRQYKSCQTMENVHTSFIFFKVPTSCDRIKM